MKYRQKKGSKPIPVLLDEKLLARIQAVSEKLGEHKSTIMRMAMRIGLEGLDKVFEGSSQNLEKLLLNEGRTEYRLQQTGAAIMHDADVEQLGREHEQQAVKKIRAGAEKNTAGTAATPGSSSDATGSAAPTPGPTTPPAKSGRTHSHKGTPRARTKT